MKNLSITLLLILSSFIVVSAQTIVKQNKTNAKMLHDGNYEEIKTSVETEKGIDTGKIYTDTKGVIYPVYKTSKDRLYVLKVSKKTGKTYKKYLNI